MKRAPALLSALVLLIVLAGCAAGPNELTGSADEIVLAMSRGISHFFSTSSISSFLIFIFSLLIFLFSSISSSIGAESDMLLS